MQVFIYSNKPLWGITYSPAVIFLEILGNIRDQQLNAMADLVKAGKVRAFESPASQSFPLKLCNLTKIPK